MGVTPIIIKQSLPYPQISAIPIAAYLRHIKVCECVFYGVRNVPDSVACQFSECRNIWTKDMRDKIQYYLSESQWEIENVLNYFVGTRWVTDERHDCRTPIIAKYGYLVEPGVRTETPIATAATLVRAGDPSTISVIGVTVTDPYEVAIFHTGTNHAITPSLVEISGGTLDIEIPRCRTVLPEKQDNPPEGVSYSDLTNFAEEIDIVQISNTNTEPATYNYRRCTTCANQTETACIYVHEKKLGILSTASCRCRPSSVDINYLAGRPVFENGSYTYFGRQVQDAIIRLAHVKMPTTPCGCDAANELWTSDREILRDGFDRVLRPETPFGPWEGAHVAWQFVNSRGMRLHRGGRMG